MFSAWQIILLIAILFLLGYGPRLLGRVFKVKKGLNEGVKNLKQSLDGSDEKEVEGEVVDSKIKKP